MKTIEDAVIELGGKLPCNTMQHSYAVVEGMLLDRRKSPVECYVCKVEEFESCAKRLGYINGYRYGVEYPTNGKRPELADDVIVQLYCETFNGFGVDMRFSDTCKWDDKSHAFHPSKFRITDQRYKPADTSYLNALTQTKSLTHSEEGLTHKDEISEAISAFCKLPNSLQDLYQESFDKWVEKRTAEIKAKTHREKVIEAAVMVVESNNSTSESIYDTLYNAGMLVLPPKKSDTKD